MRCRRSKKGVDTRELGLLFKLFRKIGNNGRQLRHRGLPLGLHIELKPAGRTQATDRWRIKDQSHAIGQAHANTREFFGEIDRRGRTLIPILERDKNRPRIRLVATSNDVTTGDYKHACHSGILHDAFLKELSCLFSPLQARPIRQYECANQIALILGRNKTARHQAKHHETPDQDRSKDRSTDHAMAQGFIDKCCVVFGE